MYTPQDVERIVRENAIAAKAYRAKQLELTAPAGRAGKYTAADVEHILSQSEQTLPTASELYREKLGQMNSKPVIFGTGRGIPREVSQEALYVLDRITSGAGATLEDIYNYAGRIGEKFGGAERTLERYKKYLAANAGKPGTDGLAAHIAEGGKFIKRGFTPSTGWAQWAAGAEGRHGISVDDKPVIFGTGRGIPREVHIQNSIKMVGDVAGGIGGMVPAMAANYIVPGSGWPVIFMGAAGNATEEAIASGASKDQALLTGTISGAVEVVVEKLFGGIPILGDGWLSKGVTGVAEKMLSGLSKTAAGKYLIGKFVNILGEGVENGLSTYAEKFIKKIYNGDQRGFLQTIAETTPEAGYSALMGVLISALLSGAEAAGDAGTITSQGKALRPQAQLLIDQGLTAPADSAAFKTAAALRAKAATGRALSDFELGALHAENAAALKAPYAAKLAEDIVRESLEQTGNAAQSAGEKSALRPIEQYLPDGPKRSITEVDRAVKIAQGDGGMPGLLTEGAGKVPKYPGNDPLKPPGEGYEWRGHPEKGSWYNPKTREVLRSDIEHVDPIGKHWDYRAPDGTWYRLYPDGHLEPK